MIVLANGAGSGEIGIIVEVETTVTGATGQRVGTEEIGVVQWITPIHVATIVVEIHLRIIIRTMESKVNKLVGGSSESLNGRHWGRNPIHIEHPIVGQGDRGAPEFAGRTSRIDGKCNSINYSLGRRDVRRGRKLRTGSSKRQGSWSESSIHRSKRHLASCRNDRQRVRRIRKLNLLERSTGAANPGVARATG